MTILKYLGYVAYFLMMLVLGLYFTFPWNAAKDRILDLASRGSGMKITAASIEPSWLTGVTATDVKITPAGATEPITLDVVTARAKVLALMSGKKGAEVSLPIAKGKLDTDFTIDEEQITAKVKAEGIELGLIPGLSDAVGLPITGTVNLNTDLTIGQKDAKLTNGNIDLVFKGLKIEKGGKLMGFPIPELSIGDADWKIPVEAGKATLKSLRVSGDSLELVADGNISLVNPIARSTVNTTLSFKPSDKLLQSEPLLGALLNNIQRAKGNDGFYTYAVMGNLKSPRFTPRKK